MSLMVLGQPSDTTGVSDPRSYGDRAREKAGVGRHLDDWALLRSDDWLRRRVLREIQRRRAGRRDLVQLHVIADRPRQETVVVRGELLVRREDLSSTAVRRLVASCGLAVRGIDAVDRRVVRLTGGALQDRMDWVLGEVRQRRLPVVAHHVTMMGGVVKSLAGPEPSAGGLPFPTVSAPPGRAGVVAVLDTGVSSRSRADGWLNGVHTEEPITPAPDGVLDPGAGHGTFTAGIVQQVAPTVDVRAYRAMDSTGVGSEARAAGALLRAAAEGADVVNLSFGTSSMDDRPPLVLEVALELLAERHPDVVVVAAAGNDGDTRPCWPAAFPDVVAVGGLTPELGAAQWSNHGEWVTCSAVAEGVVSTYVEGRHPGSDGAVFGPDPWACWTGTSFAAPQIAGTVARVSAERRITPRRALESVLDAGLPISGAGTAVRILPGT